MIKFTKIRWKNFLATGNDWIEIDLCRSPSTLITGENGAGKSTFLEALLFGLYGRPHRNINKPQLVNSITNKQCLVEVEFSSRGKDYTVRRGIKPAIFEIYENDILVHQNSSIKEYQLYLEKSILRLNQKSFTQIVVIGSANFTPFMQLKPHERREIIEDFLDIEIFSKMYLILKEKIQKNKDDIRELKYSLDLLNQKIKMTKKHINEIRLLKEKDREKTKKKIENYENEIENTRNEIRSINEKIEELRNEIHDFEKLKNKHRKLETLESQMKSRIENINQEISFFEEHDDCPTCSQEIDDLFKDKTVKEKEDLRDTIYEGLNQLQEKYEEASSTISNYMKISEDISVLQNKILTKSSFIDHRQREITELQETAHHEEDDSKVLNELDDIQSDRSKYNDKHEKLIQLSRNYDLIASLLRDGGIKSKIIRQYIPIINKMINKYLATMDFFVQFELDENFNEKIRSRFRDEFTYNSFSEGEKMRLDLALLFTWRAVAKIRNSISTNLLVMDEVFDSSLDTVGTDEFLKMIIELTNETNVFIISHKGDALYDKFHSHIRFEKVKNFSKIAA